MSDSAVNSEKPHAFDRRLAAGWPERDWRNVHTVLAVSGGADSVAMLRALAARKAEVGGRGKLYVAHLNHGLRGDAADADEVWLRELCDRLQVPLEVGRCEIGAIADVQGDGWEAAARTARYNFLTEAAERVGARYVATAHTADDQAETVLHRILRGTGIAGLAGIARTRSLTKSVTLLRPMLQLRRSEVLEYLSAIGQDFRTDASNEDMRWTRNRLRHEMLPALREAYNVRVDEALVRLAYQAGEFQQVVADLAAKAATECVVADSTNVTIDCSKLARQPLIVVRELFKVAWEQAGWPKQSMGFDEWQQLASLATNDRTLTINLPENIRARRTSGTVELER